MMCARVVLCALVVVTPGELVQSERWRPVTGRVRPVEAPSRRVVVAAAAAAAAERTAAALLGGAASAAEVRNAPLTPPKPHYWVKSVCHSGFHFFRSRRNAV